MSVIENTSHASSSASDPAAVEALKMLLDYAITEGAELQLPAFVLLLKMANLELAKSTRGDLYRNSDIRSAREAEERVAP
jgi:hypothetical protein